MQALLQRVTQASVTVNGNIYSQIDRGLVVLLGVFAKDSLDDVVKLAKKTVELRIFSREDKDKMNSSVIDVNGQILVVSQFTLCADLKKGRRPSFHLAAPLNQANTLYTWYIKELFKNLGKHRVVSGIFGVNMQVSLINDGPVTILLDTDHL